MAKEYVIKSPDGKEYYVRTPDNVTQEQAVQKVWLTMKGASPLDRAMAKVDGLPERNAAMDYFGSGGRFLAGFGKAITDVGRGAGQIVGAVPQKEIDQSAKLDRQLMDTTGGKVGNIAGNAAAFLPASLIPGVNTVAGSAALGGAVGALSPVETGGSRFNNAATGAITGGGVSAALKFAPSLAKALIDPFHQAGREQIVGRTLERFGGVGGVTHAATPGWENTVAQATGSPGMAILERGAAAATPDAGAAMATRDLEQNKAALDAIRKIGGTPEQRSMAEALRSYMSEGFYKQAAQEGIDPKIAKMMKPQIKSLLDRPSIKDAIAKAGAIIDERGMAKIKAGSVEGLQLLKQALDDRIQKAPTDSSIGKNALHALETTRADLIKVMDELTPTQRLADRNYATFSRPINEMSVGQALEQKLTPALMDGMDAPAKLRAEQFANALRNLDDQIPNMTGYKGAKVETIMSPESMRALEGVRSDLARRAAAQDSGRGVGSNTAQNLATQNIMQNIFGPMGLPKRFSEALASSVIGRTAGSPFGVIYNRAAEPSVQQEMARALMDPAYAQQLIRAANRPVLTGGARDAVEALRTGAVPALVGSRNAQQ